MRVIVWGINYAPEVTGIAPCTTALCEFLRKQGYDVEVVTTFSYYPQWEKQPADRYQMYRTDVLNGVPVHRCWHYVPHRPGVAKRVLCEASFIVSSFLRALFLKKSDIHVVISPPLLLGPAAWLMTRLKGGCYHFHVQDLQPDAALGLQMLSPGFFTKALYFIEAFSYRHARKVSGIGPGMMEAFCKKGLPNEKVVLLPNGIDLLEPLKPVPIDFRAKYGISRANFVAIYAGNLGAKQGLEIILDAARFITDPIIRLIICGDGAWRHILAERIHREKIPNVRLLPLLADADYRAMLKTADVCLITQRAGSGNAFLPSKLLPTLAYRRPVISVADEDSALACSMKAANFGVNILPDQPEALAKALLAAAADPAALKLSQENGYAYVSRFDHAKVLLSFEESLLAECSPETGAAAESPQP